MRLSKIGYGIIASIVLTGAASAESSAPPPVKTYVLSETLVNEIYTTLAKDPYSQVATVLAHLQAEVLKQPAPIAAPAEPAK